MPQGGNSQKQTIAKVLGSQNGWGFANPSQNLLLPPFQNFLCLASLAAIPFSLSLWMLRKSTISQKLVRRLPVVQHSNTQRKFWSDVCRNISTERNKMIDIKREAQHETCRVRPLCWVLKFGWIVGTCRCVTSTEVVHGHPPHYPHCIEGKSPSLWKVTRFYAASAAVSTCFFLMPDPRGGDFTQDKTT